ncbi:MAG: ribosome-associated translation inhibitor RaiA [Nitrospiraceae bacterium]
MRIMITGRHIEVTAALRRYIEARIKRLARYGMKLGGVQIVHTAEIVLALDGAVIQGKTATTEMYASIDQLMDKISRQLVKRKEKLVDHKIRTPTSRLIQEMSEPRRSVVAYETIRPPLFTHCRTGSRTPRRSGLLLARL